MEGVSPIRGTACRLHYLRALSFGMRSTTSLLRSRCGGRRPPALMLVPGFRPHTTAWCIMLPLSQRVQPGVYTLMALSRYRDPLLRQPSPERPVVYPPLIPEFLTSCFEVLFLPPRPFRTAKPRTQDAFQAVPLFLQMRCAFPEICGPHRGAGSLLLTPRLDAQTIFAKLFADIGSTNDMRAADLPALLAHGPPPPAKVTAGRTYELKRFLMLLASLPTPVSSKFWGKMSLARAARLSALHARAV